MGRRYDIHVQTIKISDTNPTVVKSIKKSPWFFDRQEAKDAWNYLINNKLDEGKLKDNESYIVGGILPKGLMYDVARSRIYGKAQINDWQKGEKERTCKLVNAEIQTDADRGDYLRLSSSSITVKRYSQESSEIGKHTNIWDRVDYFVTKTTPNKPVTAHLKFIKVMKDKKEEDVTQKFLPNVIQSNGGKIDKVLRIRAGKTETIKLDTPIILNSDYSLEFTLPKYAQVGDTYTTVATKDDLPTVLDSEKIKSLTTENGIAVHFESKCGPEVVFTNANFEIVAEPEPTPKPSPKPDPSPKPTPTPTPQPIPTPNTNPLPDPIPSMAPDTYTTIEPEVVKVTTRTVESAALPKTSDSKDQHGILFGIISLLSALSCCIATLLLKKVLVKNNC